jgi:hypothetical protein
MEVTRDRFQQLASGCELALLAGDQVLQARPVRTLAFASLRIFTT